MYGKVRGVQLVNPNKWATFGITRINKQNPQRIVIISHEVSFTSGYDKSEILGKSICKSHLVVSSTVDSNLYTI